MCKHENRIPIDGHLADAERATICADCGLFFVTIRESSDMARIEYWFKLTTLEQLMAVAEPILARRGLRIVSAREVDRSTAQRQALEDFLSEE